MSRYSRWLILVFAYAGILATPFLLRPAGEKWDPEVTLQVISPHWEGIKYEFKHGFRQWYLGQSGRKVDVEWLDIGGTSDIRRYLESEYQRHPSGIGLDLVFGGGSDFYRRIKSQGFTQPCPLPKEMLKAIPKTCAGVPMMDDEGHWFGAALSGFGIVYNKAVLKDKQLPFPSSWEALGRPELFTWIGAGDPGKSGSIHMMFEIVLQAYGWEKGMDIITRMGANARYFSDSSSEIPQDVALGEVALGMCIDFYAGSKIAEVGPDILGYVLPDGMTVINPDPIAVLKGSPHQEEAEAFVRFTMSRPGQQLWMYRKSVPGGPVKFGLARLGVLPALYKDDADKLLVTRSPFLQKEKFHYDSRKGGARWQLLNDFIRAAIIDTHEDAVAAWSALKSAGLPPEPTRRFSRPPMAEPAFMALAPKWKDAQFREQTRAGWVRWYRRKYLELAASL